MSLTSTCSYLQAKAEAKPGAQSLLPRMRRSSSSSSSSTPSQDPRPLIAGATAHITGPRAKTAADILVEEGEAHLFHCESEDLLRAILHPAMKAPDV